MTSPADDVSNGVAWTAGDSRRWWWPDLNPKRYWPAGVPRLVTLAAFEAALGSLGYDVCDHEGMEAGFEKIALFADADSFPLHVARQLPGGRWTSKLGDLEGMEPEQQAHLRRGPQEAMKSEKPT